MHEDQMRSFLSVVEQGSFNKAEEYAFLSKGAIKKQIDSLESELGCQLLIRTQKGVFPTPAGVCFCDEAKKILAQIESAKIACQNCAPREQVIRIGNPQQPRLLLENAFSEFANRYPEIRQEVVIWEDANDVTPLLEGKMDVAECIMRPNMKRADLDYTRVAFLDFKCLVAVDHPFAKRTSLCLEEFSGQTVGMSHVNCVKLTEELKKRCRDVVIMELARTDASTVYNVCFNRGVYITAAYFSTKFQPLIAVPLDTNIVQESVLLYRKDPSPAAKKFIKVVKDIYPSGRVLTNYKR